MKHLPSVITHLKFIVTAFLEMKVWGATGNSEPVGVALTPSRHSRE
ncbi:hypothetical protein CULT_2390003 [[Clostridium] ultunense Esp]|nr:hypothetical protein CULT_2390003 [[Clostridium] ultunense Esp]